MKYTAGEAAKATDVSTATITRAIKSGKISAEKDDSGAWQIDPAELHRVYPIVATQANTKESAQSNAIPLHNNSLQGEMDLLQEKLRSAERARAAAESDRDAWRDQAERLAKSLPRPASEPKPWTWRWPWDRS